VVIAGVVVIGVSGGIFLWTNQRSTTDSGTRAVVPPRPTAVRIPDLQEPAEDFSTFRHVLQTGGCDLTRPVAIAWLDRHARQHTRLPGNQITQVMTMIKDGGHPSWDPGYRQHLFNSAFNALHPCQIGEAFTRALHHLALHDGDRIMRLYAIQHLSIQRRIGHLTGILADEVRATLETLAREPGEEVSGGAILLLASWDGADDEGNDASVQQLALATAADRDRPVDIRVTAIHAAGPASLPLSRTLASDSASPVLLRKAAIAGIGRYGSAEDLDMLAELKAESSRIAQAAGPARETIQARLSNPTAAIPIPY
jgi:hypothetical protein